MEVRDLKILQKEQIQIYLSNFTGKYRTDLEHPLLSFITFINQNPGLPLFNNTRTTITHAFTQYIRYRNLKNPRTFNHYKMRIRRYFVWLYDNGIIDDEINFKDKLKLSAEAKDDIQLRELKRKNKYLTPGQFKRILTYCKTNNRYRDYICFRMFWLYGLRGEELIHVQRKHFFKSYKVDGDGNKVDIWVYVRWGKREKVSYMPKWVEVPPTLMKTIGRYFKERGQWKNKEAYLFTKLENGPKYVVTELPYLESKYFGQYFTRMCVKVLKKPYTMHDVRRGRATSLRSAGVRTHEICQTINMSEKTLERYDLNFYQIPTLDPILQKV